MNKNLLLALLSGLLLGIPFCIPELFFVIFFAWIPLLFLEEKLVQHPNSYILFNYALLSFLIWNGMAYWWVTQANFIGTMLIILLNSLLLALIFWLVSRSRISLRISILFPFLLIWLGFEYFHTQWDLAWPWLHLGNAFSSAPAWVQWYKFTGTRGGSLWILLINYSLYHIIRKEKRLAIVQILILLLLFSIPTIYSFIRFSEKEENIIGERSFALIQPNLDPYTQKFDRQKQSLHFEEFMHLADSICASMAPDFLLGPETVVLQSINEEKPESTEAFGALRKLQHKYPHTKILLGVESNKLYRSKRENYNAALLLGADAVQFYHKTRLVPLFERIPFDKYLRFLNDYSLEIGGYKGTYSDRNDVQFFAVDSIALVPVLCFESIFGDYCAQRVPEQAGFLCMLTNDGWWKNTPGYQHHFNFSRLRAIETGRHYLRVANNGISAHINSKGMVLAKTNWWHKAILSGKLSLMSGRTFYSEHGDYIGRISLFFAMLLLIFVKIRTYTANRHIRN